jgi:hypothetical protein
MQRMAANGATVRQLVQTIQAQLGFRPDAIVPLLWYFTQAFGLPLVTVLPIREWLGTDRDEEINQLILPAIQRNRPHWPAGSAEDLKQVEEG